jgi:hypothetical protein
MSTIINELTELGIPQEKLPKTLLNKIDHLEDVKETLQSTRTEYAEEQDPDVRQEMREVIIKAEETIVELEASLDEAVKAFKAHIASQANDDDDDSEKQVTPTPVNRNTAKVERETEPKKGGNGWKWLVGGVVLLVTLGAVNTLNKE